MTYEEIFSQFYSKETDPTFFRKYSKDEAYDLMRSWLHNIVATPYVKKCFSKITLDDELLEITFVLENSEDEESDNNFVRDILSDGLVISWAQKQVDKAVSFSTVIGGKEERTILNNYKNNINRLKEMKLELRKKIRDRGYIYNEYVEGDYQ